MNNEADETTVVRALDPLQFPSEPISLDFEWRAELHDRAEAQVRQTVYDAVKLAELERKPAVAIIRRLGISLAEETLNVDIYDDSGKRLCALRIGDNGFGALYLIPV